MWDERYNTPDYMYGKEPNDFLKANTSHIPNGSILCLADGEGRNSVYLAKCGYDVTAVDLSVVALEKARKLAQEQDVTVNFVHADLATYDLGQQQWDGIVSIFCHLPSTLRMRLHQTVFNGLKNKGIYLIEGYTPQQLDYKTGGPSSVDMLVSADILVQELHQMHPFMVTEKERFIQEGQLHNGRSHIVQALFIKPENDA